MKLFKFFIITLLISVPLFAQGDSFLWDLAKNHREDGNLAMEEISLRQLLDVNPGHKLARDRLDEIEFAKKSGRVNGIEENLASIQSIIRGQVVKKGTSKAQVKGFSNPDEEAAYLEKALGNKALTENQKVQMSEKLSQYYFHRGMDSIKAEKIRDAIESLEKSIHYDAKFQLSYYELGFLYFRIRELQLGIQNLEYFVELQPSGILTKTVRETLLNKYMSIARTYYFQQDFKNCKPYLERIIRLNKSSPEADTALVYLMNLYFFQGMKHLKVDDYARASFNFFQALEALKEKPSLDHKLFGKLARNAVNPFLKYAQQLFILEKNYGDAYTYFQAVTWIVPGSSQSFLAKEYMKEINRINETAENPIVYFSNFIQEENQRFLLERRGLDLKQAAVPTPDE